MVWRRVPVPPRFIGLLPPASAWRHGDQVPARSKAVCHANIIRLNLQPLSSSSSPLSLIEDDYSDNDSVAPFGPPSDVSAVDDDID